MNIPIYVLHNNEIYNVTSIESTAFYDCTDLISVTIPNLTKEIGHSAFYGCTNLKDISIGNSVEYISDYAFKNCSNLNSITIPGSVVSIGDRVFDGCNSLTNLVFDDSNMTLELGYSSGKGLFYDCPLETLYIGRNLDYYSLQDYGYSPFYGIYTLDTISIGNQVSILKECALTNTGWYYNQPDGILYLDNCCIGYKGSEPKGDLSIKYGTRLIAENAFAECREITSVNIPGSVTSIGSYAFMGCFRLNSITISNNLTYIGVGVFDVTDWIYLQPDGIIYLGPYCLGHYGALTTLSIKEGTRLIAGGAFSSASSIKTINLPNSVTFIGESAFYNCDGLTYVDIPESVTVIGKSAFARCDGLTHITIPENVVEIGCYAFSECLGLNTVAFNAKNCHTMGRKYRSVFYKSPNITNITIGSSVITIPNYAFDDCEGLTTVNFNAEHCTQIGSPYNPTFRDCSFLSRINIGSNVRTIPSNAFMFCENLTSLDIPNSSVIIGSDAFYGCTQLASAQYSATQTTITIGNLVTSTIYSPYLLFQNKYSQPGSKFTNLTPGSEYFYDLGVVINGSRCRIYRNTFKTQDIDLYLSGNTTATSISAVGAYDEGDANVFVTNMNINNPINEYNNSNSNMTFTHLDPNSTYKIFFGAMVDDKEFTISKEFKTLELTWANGRFDATSTSSARLIVETNCDATAGTGYEWRRIDAPDIIASSKVSCPVVDGMLVGTLRNLNPDVYYKFRPYYTSASGNTYYGDWVGFYTADANVYFEPEVRTYRDYSISQNSVKVKGYALEGTDVIISQGFEYWETGNSITPLSTEDRKIVTSTGIAMSATISDLEYDTTYKYRAFVTTAKGTVYGEEVEFTTDCGPTGIENIEIKSNELSVVLRENPVTNTAWIKAIGNACNVIQYTITSMSGSIVETGNVALDGEWNAIELNCNSGIYLMTVSDGLQAKTLRLIVR